jgi:transposase
LYELILTKKPIEKIFKLDQLLNAHGHTVLRLRPYNCDLSPTELAWAEEKRYFRDRNAQEDLSFRRLIQLTK